MDESIFDVAVIGLGYSGLPTSASFAAKGKRVAGADGRQSTVDALNRGELVNKLPESTILVVDPNVEELTAALAASGLSRLHSMDEAVAAADLVMLLLDHDDFLAVDPLSLEGKQIIDTQGIWNQPDVAEASRQHTPVGASVGG